MARGRETLDIPPSLHTLSSLLILPSGRRQRRPLSPSSIMTSPRWNADRAVGPRTAFTHTQVLALIRALERTNARHDLALLTVGVDTMLRASDLLRLRARDVTTADGAPMSSSSEAIGQTRIRPDLIWRQRKTGGNVAPTLTETARAALADWLRASGKRPEHFLFTRSKPTDADPISPSSYRRTVKMWAQLIGLDPTDYSSHSIRRTKPVFMYRAGCPIADISVFLCRVSGRRTGLHFAWKRSSLLGHRSNAVTRVYLGITVEHLRKQALAFDLFSKTGDPVQENSASGLNEATLDALAERIAQRLQEKTP